MTYLVYGLLTNTGHSRLFTASVQAGDELINFILIVYLF